MDYVKKLKAMLVELGRNQLLWARQLQEFETLQSQVSALQRASGFDPVARQKLSKLDEYMNREGNDAQCQIVEKIATADKKFKRVGEQLRELAFAQQGSVENEMPAPLNKAARSNSRNFV